ncbi:hypothetical protein MyNCGM121_41350 [Achromobacter xylosoxidans]
MNNPTPKTSPDAALGNLMAAALDVPAAPEQPAVPDDTLARTGNTADHQAGWFAGMEQGQANAQDNTKVHAGASAPKDGDALSLEAVDAAVAAWFASVPTASLQNDTTAHFRERMSAALRAAQVAAQPWPEAGAAQVAAYTLPDGIRVVRTSQMDGTHLWAVRTQVLAALESAQRFIRNGIEFGYIRMPDADTPDPAHRTPSMIDAAIRALKQLQADKAARCTCPSGDGSLRNPCPAHPEGGSHGPASVRR